MLEQRETCFLQGFWTWMKIAVKVYAGGLNNLEYDMGYMDFIQTDKVSPQFMSFSIIVTWEFIFSDEFSNKISSSWTHAVTWWGLSFYYLLPITSKDIKFIINCTSLVIIKLKKQYVTILTMKYCIQSNNISDLVGGAPSHISKSIIQNSRFDVSGMENSS